MTLVIPKHYSDSIGRRRRVKVRWREVVWEMIYYGETGEFYLYHLHSRPNP
jgi:hypothetical protein